MKQVKGQTLIGERALFFGRDLAVTDCVFADGESPLKESANITLDRCTFRWKYPIWYSHNVRVANCTFEPTARAGVWYTHDSAFVDCTIDAPKTFRRCSGLTLERVAFTDAAETLWTCRGITLRSVTARRGDYLAYNCTDVDVDGLDLVGNYAFDGAKNVVIRNSRLETKDAFWNSEDVTVFSSTIVGEYLGWNSRRLTLVDCTIESLQGLCYIDTLVLKNCRLVNTTLAFEYSTVEADIVGSVDSVLNPSGGTIRADSIGELTIERDRVDPSKTVVICRNAD